MKVCPRCGRTEKEVPFIGFLCRDCYLETHDVVHIPHLELKVCPTCGRVYVGRWVPFSLDVLRSWVRKHVKADVDDAFVSVGMRGKLERPLRVTILVSGSIEGVPVQVSREVEIPVVYQQCPDCARRAGGYYEAVVQIRGADVERAADILRRWISRSGGQGAYVAREVRRKEGIDIYVGSRKLAEKLAARLARTFQAETKRSYTLVTEKNGKKVYRVTVLVRIPGKGGAD